MKAYQRAGRALLITFLLYALLVATHAGEFWPFSIYPMFSKAGQPWSRTVVRTVEATPGEPSWGPVSYADLPGEPFAVLPNGIDPIDLANFVVKTEEWSPTRVEALRQMFYDQLDEQRLLVMRVDGYATETDSVVVQFDPYVVLDADTAWLNPKLWPQEQSMHR